MHMDSILGTDQEIWNFINESRSLHHVSLASSNKLLDFLVSDRIDYRVSDNVYAAKFYSFIVFFFSIYSLVENFKIDRINRYS